jgi:uncharacterized protein (TIGR00159 family)
VPGDLGLADALDIAIVGTLIYGGIAWLRRSRGALVAIGLGALGLLYLGAWSAGLTLTTQVFHALTAALLVVLVVLFQEELRQSFEELAAWLLGRGGSARPRYETRDVLVRTAFHLAREKVGALIVLPGAQPLDRHVQGGIELDGLLSEELLASVFDAHSPGHDGAAIVENRRVTRFAVHLPLSRRLAFEGRAGTRHRAALGLAERSDALCLIVSEERGVVSMARAGTLREVGDPKELGKLLDRFYKERLPLARRRPRLLEVMTHHLGGKAIALVSACALWWVFVPGGRPVERAVEVPVALAGLPPGFEVEAVEPENVRATFRGRRRDLWLMPPAPVEVDASVAAPGAQTYEVHHRDFPHPPEVHLERFEPRKIRVSLRVRDDIRR